MHQFRSCKGAHSATKWRASRKGHPNALAPQDEKHQTHIFVECFADLVAPSACHHTCTHVRAASLLMSTCSSACKHTISTRWSAAHMPKGAQSATQWKASRKWYPMPLRGYMKGRASTRPRHPRPRLPAPSAYRGRIQMHTPPCGKERHQCPQACLQSTVSQLPSGGFAKRQRGSHDTINAHGCRSMHRNRPDTTMGSSGIQMPLCKGV